MKTMTYKWITSLVVVALFFGASASAVADGIKAPFGLQWGSSPDPILTFAQRTGIQKRSLGNGRETIEVRGPFPGQRYYRLEFTFQADHLVEVAVYYQAPEDGNGAKELLAVLRREIERSFGAGQLLETGTEKNSEGFVEARRVFRWENEGCAIWLISLQLQNAEASNPPLGEISVVYANLGLSRQIEIDSQK
jgi:hypothetical protein